MQKIEKFDAKSLKLVKANKKEKRETLLMQGFLTLVVYFLFLN